MFSGLLKSFLIILAAFISVFLFSAPSWSADWEVSPCVTIIEEYDDNIDFSVDEKKRYDWVTYVKPRVEGIYRTERFSLFFDSGIKAEKYVNCDDKDKLELNTIDHDHKIALLYALSGSLSLRTGGYLKEDVTGDDSGDDSGDWEDRRKFGGNLGFNYVFSMRFKLSGDWIRKYIKNPDDPDYNYERVRTDTLKLAPQYVLSPRTSLFLNLEYNNTEHEKNFATDELDKSIVDYNISPSFRHDFTENFYVSGKAGYYHAEKNIESDEESRNDFFFKLSFHKDWERVSMELLTSRKYYGVEDEKRDKLVLKGSYRFSDRLRSGLIATFRRNHDGDNKYNNSDYYIVSPSLSYNLTPSVTLKASADYSKEDYDKRSNEDRERFMARLFLNFTWPRFWSGH